MVQRECEVDHVVLVDSTQLVEPLALQDLQMTDAGSLGQAWRVAREAWSGEGSELCVLEKWVLWRVEEEELCLGRCPG